MKYILAIDLGCVNDFAAIGLLELDGYIVNKLDPLRHASDPSRYIATYKLRKLERVPLGTSYPDLIIRIKNLLESPILFNRTTLVMDATGVGIGVVQFAIDAGLKPIGVTFTSGKSVGENDLGYTVPKLDLVMNMILCYESQKVQMSMQLENMEDFIHELKNFKMKKTNKGNDVAEAGKERDHDDLIIAVALALWYAEVILGGSKRLSDVKKDQDDYNVLYRK